MARFIDLLVKEGPAEGMRYSVEVGTYRVLGRAGETVDSTVQMTQEGDRLLDADQKKVVEGVVASRKSRGLRTKFKKRGADILLDDNSVSRTHAMIFADEDGTSVADLMSTNGTKVNGSLISDVDLNEGDVLQLGKCKLALSS
ncbi:MAG: FHA domain-containing protein [Deltaproteobacteria bacterium]|nr:FHA domain-containing protein [Deltaproteobacteria bacterium]